MCPHLTWPIRFNNPLFFSSLIFSLIVLSDIPTISETTSGGYLVIFLHHLQDEGLIFGDLFVVHAVHAYF
jgi:hypothetical protein